MANTANNWGEMPVEIAAKIADHVELYDDYEAFREVCSTWRLAMKEFPHQYINKNNTQPPLLMLVDPNDCPYRRFYSLTKRNFLKVDLPPSVVRGIGIDDQTPSKQQPMRRYFSSQGWLISVSPTSTETSHCFTYKITLFNPLSNNMNVIEPPRVHFHSLGTWIDSPDLVDANLSGPRRWEDVDLLTKFEKFVLSTTPSHVNEGNYNDNFIIAMTFGHRCQLAFWRPGQDRWVVPRSSGLNDGWFHDLCFFRGEFYAICTTGKLIAFGDLKDDWKDHKNTGRPPRVVVDLKGLIGEVDSGNYYLVESLVENEDHASCLLLIKRIVYVKFYAKTKYWTASFEVFKVNVDNGDAERVSSLGNQAIFVGLNSTFSVKASANIKANCIYYTDDAFEVYGNCKRGGGGGDMGIYSLTLGKFIHYQRPFYQGPPSSRFSLINPPVWVEFSRY